MPQNSLGIPNFGRNLLDINMVEASKSTPLIYVQISEYMYIYMYPYNGDLNNYLYHFEVYLRYMVLILGILDPNGGND